MGTPIKGFIGPAYTSISRSINAQRCVNLRMEIDAANGKVPVALVGLPGYVTRTLIPYGAVRGFWKANGRLFVVAGNKLFELFEDFSVVDLAFVSSDTNLVSMADNGIHLMVVDGSGVVALDLATSTVTTIIENFPYGARSIGLVDNTFIAVVPGTQQFQISAVGDALTWSALDFTSAEGLPDNIVAMIVYSRQVYFLGVESLQVFWNTGDALRPFAPIEGTMKEVGCIAPYSVSKDESGVYWLGQDSRGSARVYKGSGGDVVPISTPALDAEIRGYSKIDDAEAYNFRLDGHVFYVLAFPTADRTWLYDASTEAWSEYLEWVVNDWKRHRIRCAIHVFGTQYAGDWEEGRIYEMSPDIYSNDERPMRALRASAHVSQNQDQIIVGSIEIVTEPGVGLTTGQGALAQMMLRTSKDGGFTFTPEMVRSMGAKGEYRNRCKFNRPHGVARDIVYEISISDPVKRVILAGVLNGE